MKYKSRNGGNDMINVTRSSMPPMEEYMKEIADIWDTCILTNMGDKHKKLQALLENYCGVAHVNLFTNGHLALENAIAAMKLPKSSEVITTPFTFASTTHAIVRNGLRPVFCDINPQDYTLDVSKIERLINRNTSAILPVHVYGNVCDVEAIESIARRYRLKVIYDAAHAFGVEYKGKGIASYGDISMFSFHATKVFNTIEGGAACCNDSELNQLLNDLKNFGIRGKESVEIVGGNAKMSEFQAAMGICNLRYFEDEIRKREKVFCRYIDRLGNVDGLKIPSVQENVKPNYAYFPIVFDKYRFTRDEIYAYLSEKGIMARKYFYPLTCDFECYKNHDMFSLTEVPIARKISKQVLTLPLYAGLDLNTVDDICDLILAR